MLTSYLELRRNVIKFVFSEQTLFISHFFSASVTLDFKMGVEGKRREVEVSKSKASRTASSEEPVVPSELSLSFVRSLLCGLSETHSLNHQVTNAAILGSTMTPPRYSRCYICPQELPLKNVTLLPPRSCCLPRQADTSTSTHSLPDWFAPAIL